MCDTSPDYLHCVFFQEVWVLTVCFPFFSMFFCLFLLVSFKKNTPSIPSFACTFFLVSFSKFQTYFHVRLGNLKFQELGKIKLALAEVAADGKMP